MWIFLRKNIFILSRLRHFSILKNSTFVVSFDKVNISLFIKKPLITLLNNFGFETNL